ncbi:uncharacterized protein EHS24_006598 [Apiotrichum porosum]|uniref:Dihydroxyacetone synthase n=1 Tax=Apiotrichum porosum TaxID=105984 RepID=A0A427Y1W4_9TREE|nr:uncharacterized protein EHS24_006598 [Apiotrichum porosum]RSH85013.1 hypothetical protein EHS24_006598 [Apiotrichum porosum]
MLVRGFIAAVILATHATAAMSAVWSGCAVNALIGLPLGFWTYGTGYSQASCNTKCYTEGYAFSYFGRSTIGIAGMCSCAAVSTAQPVLRNSAPSQCTGAQLTVTALSTSFQFGGCASTVSRQDSGPSATFVDFSACWSFCANYIYAIIDPDAIVFYRCYCANTPPIIVSSNICGSNYFMYSHSAAQAASGIARRSRRDEAEARQRLLAAHKDCPVGYDACLLSDDPNDDSYECLKTHSELESCGGCKYGYHSMPEPGFSRVSAVE